MRIVLMPIWLLIGLFQVFGLLGLRINTSPSLPVGLYLASETGEFIEFCPAGPFASIALARGYRDRGICADGGAPLLKPVAARSGDVVDFSDAGIAVNEIRIPNTVPLAADTNSRPLRHWQFGRYTVAPGTVWVASSYSGRSFDSRYFGPIPVDAIRSRVRPILTF